MWCGGGGGLVGEQVRSAGEACVEGGRRCAGSRVTAVASGEVQQRSAAPWAGLSGDGEGDRVEGAAVVAAARLAAGLDAEAGTKLAADGDCLVVEGVLESGALRGLGGVGLR